MGSPKRVYTIETLILYSNGSYTHRGISLIVTVTNNRTTNHVLQLTQIKTKYKI